MTDSYLLLSALLVLLFMACSPTATNFDFDGDGSSDSADCDPEDPEVHPGAGETCDDGIDNDCDGNEDCFDADCALLPVCGGDASGDDDDSSQGDDDDSVSDEDGDGWRNDEDCDDSDPAVHPDAGDTADDGIDSDCDGMDCQSFFQGDVYFTYCSLVGNSWQEASEYCVLAGYDGLASLLSPIESSSLASAALKVGGPIYWIGLSDQKEEGAFVWSDGSKADFSNWKSGEPNDADAGEDCAHADPKDGRWNDRSCGALDIAFSCSRR